MGVLETNNDSVQFSSRGPVASCLQTPKRASSHLNRVLPSTRGLLSKAPLTYLQSFNLAFNLIVTEPGYISMTSPRPLAPDNSPSSESSASSDLSTEPSNSFESGRTVRSYMEDLKHPQAMEHAERQARQMIQSLENAPAEDGGRSPNLYSNPAIPDVEVKLHKILEAMLANAEACGGSHGKCYTIASICSAGRSSKSKEEDDIQFLRNLGVTWLSNFLWVCE